MPWWKALDNPACQGKPEMNSIFAHFPRPGTHTSNWTKACRKLNLDAQCVRKAMGDCEPSGSECKQCKKSAPRHWMRSADIDRFIKDSEIGFWNSAAGKKIYKNMRRDFQREVDKK